LLLILVVGIFFARLFGLTDLHRHFCASRDTATKPDNRFLLLRLCSGCVLRERQVLLSSYHSNTCNDVWLKASRFKNIRFFRLCLQHWAERPKNRCGGGGQVRPALKDTKISIAGFENLTKLVLFIILRGRSGGGATLFSFRAAF
jgi:hypothetical protein